MTNDLNEGCDSNLFSLQVSYNIIILDNLMRFRLILT